MAQNGYVFRQGNAWHIRYRHTVDVDGVLTVKQKCKKLADYCDRYRSKKDLADLIAEKLATVRTESKCPEAARMFTAFVEATYFPYVVRTKKASTAIGRRSYWKHYIRPRVANLAIRDFSTRTIYLLLKDVARSCDVNVSTLRKIRLRNVRSRHEYRRVYRAESCRRCDAAGDGQESNSHGGRWP